MPTPVKQFVEGLLGALGVALRNFVKPDRITIYYPFEKKDYEGRLRGWIRLDIARCTSCNLCARICPTNAIKMYEAPNGKRYPGIDYGRCILCHFCVSVCPTDALIGTEIADLAFTKREDLLYTPDKELEPPNVPNLAKVLRFVDYVYRDGRVVKVVKRR